MKYLNCSCRHNVLCRAQPRCILPEALLPSKHQCSLQAPSPSSQTTICWILMSLNLCLAIHLFPQLCKGCLNLLPGFERWYSRGEQEKQCQFGNSKIKKKIKLKLKQNTPKPTKTKMKTLFTISLLFINPYKQESLRRAIPEMGYTLVHKSFFKMCICA